MLHRCPADARGNACQRCAAWPWKFLYFTSVIWNSGSFSSSRTPTYSNPWSWSWLHLVTNWLEDYKVSWDHIWSIYGPYAVDLGLKRSYISLFVYLFLIWVKQDGCNVADTGFLGAESWNQRLKEQVLQLSIHAATLSDPKCSKRGEILLYIF